MLSPSDRTVFTETLRPPAGYDLDRVITTTYTLDLVTLLTLPLSFTLLSGDGMNENGRVDPIALLNALRRHADRITVFCDAGHTAVPRRGERLFGFLEKSVVQVTAPMGGVFHPKVTVVRYRPNPRDIAWADVTCPSVDAARYRFLCGTRNLTFDRSWDTMLVLEGDVVTTRKKAFGRNRPLSQFVAALPPIARHPMSESRRKDIEVVADELLRVAFVPPAGFGDGGDDLAFWPLGLDAREAWPFGRRTDRLLVVAPFIDHACLGRLRDETNGATLVSRPEEMDRLPTGTLDGFVECFTLSDAAEVEPNEEANGAPAAADAHSPDDDAITVVAATDLRGLHAKLYLADAGWHSTLWTGSANATSAAFKRNVEFLVELRGKRSVVGIDAMLGQADDAGGALRDVTLRSMLTKYEPPSEPDERDPASVHLEELCDTARKAWVAANVTAHVRATTAEATSFDVALHAAVTPPPTLPDGVTCTVQSVSRLHDPPASVVSLQGEIALFSGLAVESLSSFFAVTVTASHEGESLAVQFVLNVPLIGAPENRENRLLLAMLSNRERLIRYLLMLLAGPDVASRELEQQAGGGTWNDAHFMGGLGLPLLEPLLRTLANDPARLAGIERLVQDLESTDEGAALLPEDFVSVWGPIRTVMIGMQREAT